MKNPYDDIIGLPHHVSRNHPPMPMRDRAAQFAPFAALAGYGDAIAETARPTDERREPDEQAAEELDRRLNELIARLPEHPQATIEYFVPDARKSGGAYMSVTGRVKRISAAERLIVMTTGDAIPLESIASLEIAEGSQTRNSREEDR